MKPETIPTVLSVENLLKHQANHQPTKVFLFARNRESLTYQQAYLHSKKAADVLYSLGIRHNDRIAMIMPTTPETKVAFLALTMVATCAPMNPTYRHSEFEFFFTDLNVKALFTYEGFDTIARQVAQEKNIPVIEIKANPDAPAGAFDFVNIDWVTETAPYADLEDVAMVLHTSGTTSRPKIVPLTHRNIYLAGWNTTQTLELTAEDRSLNVLPLFHVHGLIGVLFTTLVHGGTIICTNGFEVDTFFEYLRDTYPTWYTAGPTVHQAILERAGLYPDIIKNHTLKFIRSASASLSPSVLNAIESTFRVPLVESYGLSEASHILSNPMPPRARKTGSVGIPAGTEVAIMDENGNFLAAGQPGEIVAKGLNVTQGYADNPEANASAFINGWFRTGDQGYFDEDGYFFITGRIKEIINRAGEKVSPRELDDLLITHGSVAEVAAFSIPHELLGEDVAVAIVKREGSILTAMDVKAFVAQHFAHYKVPGRVIFVDQIPKGPTGKVQRRLLPSLLGLLDADGKVIPPTAEELTTHEGNHVEPKTFLGYVIREIWKSVLKLEHISIHDNFFMIGGNSLLAARVIGEIERQTGNRLPTSILFSHPTIADLKKLIFNQSLSDAWKCLVPVRKEGSKVPIYCTHPNSGGIEYVYRLAEYLDPDQPVYGLQAVGLDGKTEPLNSNEEMAEYFIQQILEVQPQGPYNLAGYSSGGSVAYAMAQILTSRGYEVNQLFMFDTYPPARFPFNSRVQLPYLAKNALLFLTNPLDRTYYKDTNKWKVMQEEIGSFTQELKKKVDSKLNKQPIPVMKAEHMKSDELNDKLVETEDKIRTACYVAHYNYHMQPYKGDLVLVRSLNNETRLLKNVSFGWNKLVKGRLSVHDVPADHFDIFLHDHTTKMTAEIVQRYLNESIKDKETRKEYSKQMA
ncbi:non-ribosomal peptide synthetase [Xanthocytophaga flava]|uniref:non-ribosomal peptide synthetase n=1 Tax=Xanthocytophaga flava TaxID=3048013 RepID=UPI0028D7F732|nr:non-ribosomal peptide synthetase [Xanthocytophaga flavus]MDJ1468330.1 non-ribosomal peptide synthetase [Xanthocytophaga flavus]